MIVGYDITANFANYYLFKNEHFSTLMWLFSRNLSSRMETRVPASINWVDANYFLSI